MAPALPAATAMTPAMERAADPVVHPGPADQQEDGGGADQGGDGHARDRVGADADLAGDPGETTTKKNPKMMMRMAPRRLTADLGQNRQQERQRRSSPASVTQIGRSMSVREPAGRFAHAAPEILEAGAERRDDRGQSAQRAR